MKSIIKLFGIVVFISAIVFSGISCTRNNSESDFEARPIEGGSAIEITGYVGESWEVRIPPRIRNLPVTNIGQRAFREKNLISVVIPNGVIEIGDVAFSNNQLTSITIPNSVTEIGHGAFSNNQLTSITIPNSITEIAFELFSNNQLTSINIPDSVTRIGHRAFSNNLLTNVSIPNSVTHLSGFSNNHLTNIVIPNSVTHLSGFSNNHLANVTIPNGVTHIGSGTFRDNQITSISFPNSVTNIGTWVFEFNTRDSAVTNVTIGANVILSFSESEGRQIIEYYINPSIPGFDDFYRAHGNRAGTYIFSNGRWSLTQ